ncbi:MAG: PilX N-terminal domain-containing pilus assembly protein [Vulcanimicrobiota bacterium]
MQQDRLGPLKKSRQAVVLPSLVLVTMVLVVLATALLSSGTSSLRLSTFDQQSDQALYAAEAGSPEPWKSIFEQGLKRSLKLTPGH